MVKNKIEEKHVHKTWEKHGLSNVSLVAHHKAHPLVFPSILASAPTKSGSKNHVLWNRVVAEGLWEEKSGNADGSKKKMSCIGPKIV